jgi:hypothetical protein
MKKILALASVLLMLFMGVLTSCRKESEDDEGGCGATNISAAGERESHNMGRNCMNCHVNGGNGEGCFTAAGTVYTAGNLSQTKANTVVKLYTAPNGGGTLKATINGDALGNFYTTNGIDFSGGLYPALTSGTRTIYMSQPITQGACNGCHGASSSALNL